MPSSLSDLLRSTSWTLRGVRALDPATGTDAERDLFCVRGRLSAEPEPGAPALDARGLLAMPAANAPVPPPAP